MKLLRSACVAILLAGLAAPIWAGSEDIREFAIFGGGNTSAAVDTVELASAWFPVRGASRVVLRIWSANTSAWTGADSIYTDSLTTFKVLVSDSICCYVTSPTNLTIPSMADSIQIDMSSTTTNPDTSGTGIGAFRIPINKPLAPAKSGSGLTCTIYPLGGYNIGATAVSTPDARSIFGKGYMRIRTQPVRRNTEGGRLSTAGKRTAGIRGLRMRALVYYANR